METRNCQNCKTLFCIEPEDFAFYEKIKVPPPTWCPECRLKRRQVWRNERTLYKRTCDLCGILMMAMYPQDAVFPVYCRSCWYSDKWDPISYGRDYDFSKPFFRQFRELLNVVPRISLQIVNCVNSDYTNQILDCKDCYLVFGAGWNEECSYAYRIISSKKVIDGFFIEKNEQCYEIAESHGSALVFFSQNVIDSMEVLFSYDVSGANHCFMSSNIRQGSYYFRNEKLSKEEYQRRMAEIDTGSYVKLEKLKEEFREMYAKSIHRYMNSKNAVDSSGHNLDNTRNSHHCFNSYEMENCRYMLFGGKAKDSMDVVTGDGLELGYENATSGVDLYDVKFSSDTWPSVHNLEYCDSCRDGAGNLFGCISLRKRQYCILNKQYSEQEYRQLILKIKAQMDSIPYTDSKGREYKYGEYFPIEIAPFAYNESMAYDWFPLTQEHVDILGWRWREEADRATTVDVAHDKLPDHIKETEGSIVGKIIGCIHVGACNHKCTLGFRIIPSEFEFYKSKNIALPRLCPSCRHYGRIKNLALYKIYQRQCMCDNILHSAHVDGRCPIKFQTPYAPDRPEIVYCEQCYQQEVQ